jgi:hypothetical protein
VRYYEGNSTGISTNYTTALCSSATFPASNWTLALAHRVNEARCISPSQLSLRGAPYSTDFKYIYASVGG